MALDRAVDREAGEQHGGDRMARHVPRDVRRRVCVRDLGDRERVVCDDALLLGIRGNVRPRRPDAGGAPRMLAEPCVERSLAG